MTVPLTGIDEGILRVRNTYDIKYIIEGYMNVEGYRPAHTDEEAKHVPVQLREEGPAREGEVKEAVILLREGEQLVLKAKLSKR